MNDELLELWGLFQMWCQTWVDKRDWHLIIYQNGVCYIRSGGDLDKPELQGESIRDLIEQIREYL